jgi:AsmA family protein
MRWKWVLGVIAFLMLAVAVAVYTILSSYDFNDLKPQLARMVKDATGRELLMGGDLEFGIGLAPTLVIGDVSFQNVSWGSRPEMVKIKRLEVQLAVLPLFKRIILFKRLILIEPDILIETNKTGNSNLEFITLKNKKVATPVRQTPSNGISILSALTFNDIRIEKGLFTYNGGQSGRTYTVDLESATAVAGADGLVDLKLNGAYNRKPFQVKASLGALTALTDPDRTWPVNLTSHIAGSTVTIDGAVKDPIKGKGLAVTVTGAGRSIPEILKLFNITYIPELGPFDVTAKLVDPEGRLGLTDIDLKAGTKETVKTRVAGTVENITTIKGMNLNVDIQGNDLANLEKITGKPIPLSGPFSISGNAVALSAKSYKISDLKASVQESDLKGWMEINLGGKKPRITADLSSQKLDFRLLLSKKDSRSGESEKDSDKLPVTKGKVFSHTPLPLEILKQVNAEIELNAKQLLLPPPLFFSDTTAHMVIEDGHLTVNPINLVVGGGTLDGHFDIHVQDKAARVATALKIDQYELGSMFKKLEINDSLHGNVDIELNLESRGNSIAELMSGLNGRTMVVMGDGMINQNAVKLLGSELSSGLLQLLNPLKKKEEYAKINCFAGGFDIKNGLAQSSALVLDTHQVRVFGYGKIDLKTEEIDLSLKPSPKSGMGINGLAKLSLSLGELTRPLKLKGTFSNPSLSIDPTESIITLGKAIGGVALFGPFGVAAVLANGQFGDKNQCVAIIEAAKKEFHKSEAEKTEDKKGVIQKTTEGIGNGLKKLLGQ